MRLPHRTPWASLSELDELCSWVYADATDTAAKTMAVQRVGHVENVNLLETHDFFVSVKLSAWRAITALPHALESLLSILSVMLQDENRDAPSSSLSLRQSYATAIIRLVNGLVDPLQVGVYARSIASIAAQLGLPGWLVELRHAATHEDLPSVELLRQAAREVNYCHESRTKSVDTSVQSLDWLFQNYFMPTLNPSTASTRRPAEPRPLGPLLAQYKSLSKVVSRDTTLANQYQADIQSCLRDIGRWISEAKISASSTFGLVDGDEDDREAQALDQFCGELLARGVLIPLSKK